jgi:hypothetical protein
VALYTDNQRVANLENALAHLNIALHRAREIVRRLGYLIDPLVERRLDELMDAILTAQQYISAERARKE